MKEQVLSFFKPRLWTVIFTVLLVVWQYLYAYQGVDFGVLSQVRAYFGLGLTVVNWNNLLIRTFSLGLIWILVAFFIFFMLWIAQAYVVFSHNRKIRHNYVNQPPESFSHLLRTHDLSFKKHFASQLWLSAFLVLIPVGLFLISGLVEMARSNAVFIYFTGLQDSGVEADFNNIGLVAVSFLLTLPFWYLYACFDSLFLTMSQRKQEEAKIESDHYAVPVVAPTVSEEDEFADDDEEDDTSSDNSSLPPAPVI